MLVFLPVCYSEGSQVSKVTVCVQIQKWGSVTTSSRIGIGLAGAHLENALGSLLNRLPGPLAWHSLPPRVDHLNQFVYHQF